MSNVYEAIGLKVISLLAQSAEFSAKPSSPKKKNCSATSHSCGFSCISGKKVCRIGMSMEQQRAAKKLRKELGAEPAEKFNPFDDISIQLPDIKPKNFMTLNTLEPVDLDSFTSWDEMDDFVQNQKVQKAMAARGTLDINQATFLPKTKTSDFEATKKAISKLPDGHIVSLHMEDKALAKKMGIKESITNRGFLRSPLIGFVGVVKNGELTNLSFDELSGITGIREQRERATSTLSEMHEDIDGNPLEKPVSKATQNRIYKDEDRIHEQIDKIENQYLGRKPTGKHGDYSSYEKKSADWAKAKFGDFNEGANGFSLAQTKAHDIAHPVTHDLVGMDSDRIHSYFGKMKDASGKDALYGEEAIVNVMEQLSRGSSIEASILNGVRLARVMVRGGVSDDAAFQYVRSPEFTKKLSELAHKAYRQNDFAPLIAHVRKSNRISGTVKAAGDNFNNSASGG